jgi:hypothetical protein
MDGNALARARGFPDEVVIVIVIVGKMTSQKGRRVALQVCDYCVVWLRRWGGWVVLGRGGRSWLGLGSKAPVRSAQSRKCVDLKKMFGDVNEMKTRRARVNALRYTTRV